MPQANDRLQELLATQDAHAPWFLFNEHQPDALKRNLKLLRKLNKTSALSLEDLEQFSEQAINSALSNYTKTQAQSPPVPVQPSTPAQFFYSRMSQSPYFYDISHYSEPNANSPSQDSTLSTSKPSSRAPSEQVHGFPLNENEAFTATRYYSEDKSSYGKIVAKNGAFTATSKNLTEAQNTDLALEMSYQCLLNLPADKTTIHIHGSDKNIHQLHAALLYLQKEASPRYDHIKFSFPEGMSITPDEDYISRHLGTFSEPPHQIAQWQDFLKMNLNAPSHKIDMQPKTSEQRVPLIDMERVFNTEELSQQDKAQLNEYQRYLQDGWIGGLKELKEHSGDTEFLMRSHDAFLQRTESAIRLLRKSPALNNECEALIALYTKTAQTYQKTLEGLYQNDLAYETQVKELMPKVQQAQKEALEECVHELSRHLHTALESTRDLSEAQQTRLKQHQNTLKDLNTLIKSSETLSDEMRRAMGAQMLHALKDLESIKDYSKSPLVQHMKEFAKEQSVAQSQMTQTNSEGLLHATTQVKQRLNQFKSELQAPVDSEVTLSAELKEQLSALEKQIERFVEGLDTGELPPTLEKLGSHLNDLSTKTSASLKEWDALKQHLDDALPHLEHNRSLAKACTALKNQMSTSILETPPPNITHEGQGLTQ
ncbi:hypothetical protein J2N86_16140 (plasmid) [Legionella lytica]|uniref:Dot/Icm system substrate protein LidA n=1 Tax=Legionella lytica TaxID=96232 RepID=A0ABY4YD83_9GAMM|nr:hypothetical protein [Legionella lytica]USQ15551.1 hypothetical protein J2N86_16140 [Legionella lytica]